MYFILVFCLFFLFFIFRKELKSESDEVQTLRLAIPKIIEIKTSEECISACQQIEKDCLQLPVLGFDCEWVNYCTRKPVALLQLGTTNETCYLFRLNLLGFVPVPLRHILENSSIIKLGVQPKSDADYLFCDYRVQVVSTLDLRFLYGKGSLKSLTECQYGYVMNKALARSNWEKIELSDDEKLYAAMDAHAATQLFKKWLLFKSNKHPFNLLHVYYEHFGEIFNYLNVAYKVSKPSQEKSKIIPEIQKNTGKFLPESSNENGMKRSKSHHAARKTPLYDDCLMYAPDGELLNSCNRKKADWYVEKGLAEVTEHEPYSVKLFFEPSNRSSATEGGRYYQQLKKNYCVVCGSLNSLLRHYVVPQEYRKHFPQSMKDHQSHDILLMCINCHNSATKIYDLIKKNWSIAFNAPMLKATPEFKHHQKVKRFANTLLKAGDKLPIERKIYLEKVVKEHAGVERLTASILKQTAELDLTVFNENDESHGRKVVNFFMEWENGLQYFEKYWRQVFLKEMKPKYLPHLWSVDHNHTVFLPPPFSQNIPSLTLFDK